MVHFGLILLLLGQLGTDLLSRESTLHLREGQGRNYSEADPPVVPPRQGVSEKADLFNGKSLDGWVGHEKYWSVVDVLSVMGQIGALPGAH